MANPYESPRAKNTVLSPRKRKTRWVKHLVVFFVLVLLFNINRFLGNENQPDEIPRVSFTARVIAAALFYWLGLYCIWSWSQTKVGLELC